MGQSEGNNTYAKDTNKNKAHFMNTNIIRHILDSNKIVLASDIANKPIHTSWTAKQVHSTWQQNHAHFTHSKKVIHTGQTANKTHSR